MVFDRCVKTRISVSICSQGTIMRVITFGLLLATLGVFTNGLVPHTALAAEHTLMPTPQTVHIGHFSAAVKPVLTIESGDIVTLESGANMAPAIIEASGVVPPSAIPQYLRDIYAEVKDRGPAGHILTGPIGIKGA